MAPSALLLVLLGVPFLSARFENGDARTLPRSSEVRATALALADRFPARGTDPVTVIAERGRQRPRLRGVARRHLRVRRCGRRVDAARDAARDHVVDLVPAGTSQGAQATAVVEQIRTEPPAFETQVGGPAAELLDVKDKLSARLPVAGAMVVLATLVLLFMMTGSSSCLSRRC